MLDLILNARRPTANHQSHLTANVPTEAAFSLNRKRYEHFMSTVVRSHLCSTRDFLRPKEIFAAGKLVNCLARGPPFTSRRKENISPDGN